MHVTMDWNAPNPPKQQQKNISCGHCHAEQHCCDAFMGTGSLAKICIHNAHRNEIEHEIRPVQVDVVHHLLHNYPPRSATIVRWYRLLELHIARKKLLEKCSDSCIT
jgi:hypothetical protein